MMKLYQIANAIGVDKGNLSKMLSGKRKVSWPLAQRLSKMFPGRDVESWKNATPEQIRSALNNQAILKCPNDIKAPTEDKVQ